MKYQESDDIIYKPKVGYIDDDPLISMSFQWAMTDADVLLFSTPEQFLNEAKKDDSYVNSFSVIIIDHYFDKYSTILGTELAAILRKEYSCKIPLVLCSNAEITKESMDLSYLTCSEARERIVTAVICKEPLTFQELLEKINKNRFMDDTRIVNKVSENKISSKVFHDIKNHLSCIRIALNVIGNGYCFEYFEKPLKTVDKNLKAIDYILPSSLFRNLSYILSFLRCSATYSKITDEVRKDAIKLEKELNLFIMQLDLKRSKPLEQGS